MATITGTTVFPSNTKGKQYSSTTTGAWKQGKSAYQVWLDEGNEGSRTDFLESLKGSSVSVKSIEETDDGVIVTLEDASGDHVFMLLNGKDTGGLELSYSNGAICWKKDGQEESTELVNVKELIDERVSEEFDGYAKMKIVSQLPSPEDVEDGVIYILKEEG